MVWMKKAGKGVLIAFLSLTLVLCIAATVAVLYAGKEIGAIESGLDADMFAGGADRTTRLYYYEDKLSLYAMIDPVAVPQKVIDIISSALLIRRSDYEVFDRLLYE